MTLASQVDELFEVGRRYFPVRVDAETFLASCVVICGDDESVGFQVAKTVVLGAIIGLTISPWEVARTMVLSGRVRSLLGGTAMEAIQAIHKVNGLDINAT